MKQRSYALSHIILKNMSPSALETNSLGDKNLSVGDEPVAQFICCGGPACKLKKGGGVLNPDVHPFLSHPTVQIYRFKKLNN